MQEQIKEVIARHLNVQQDQLNNDLLLEDLVQDSIMLIGIVAELTDKFQLNIDPVKLNNVRTVGEAISALSDMPKATSTKNY